MLAFAVRCLARRDHSRQEMRDRLLRRDAATAARERAHAGADAQRGAHHCADRSADDPVDRDNDPGARAVAVAAAVDSVLDRLAAMGYLDDARMARSRAAARSNRHGLRRIQQDLSQRGISLDAPSRAALQQSEPERALALWQRRFGMPPVDLREQQRQIRFLLGRGFAADIVMRIVGRPRQTRDANGDDSNDSDDSDDSDDGSPGG